MPSDGSSIDLRFPELHDPVWLRRSHVIEGLEVDVLAERIGCSAEMVRRALRRHQIGSRSVPDVEQSSCPELNDPVWLQQAYVEDGLTGAAIAERVGCTVGDVYRALRRAGLGPKSPQRSTR